MKRFFISVFVEFSSAVTQKIFIHGEISIQPKLGFHFHQRQKSQSRLLLGNQKVDPCSMLPKMKKIVEIADYFIQHVLYLTDSYIGFTLKMESVSKNTNFGLIMMVKSGLEKNILKSLHAGR